MKHNREISSQGLREMHEKNEAIIDTVAVLNTSYLSLKDSVASLNEEVSLF